LLPQPGEDWDEYIQRARQTVSIQEKVKEIRAQLGGKLLTESLGARQALVEVCEYPWGHPYYFERARNMEDAGGIWAVLLWGLQWNHRWESREKVEA